MYQIQQYSKGDLQKAAKISEHVQYTIDLPWVLANSIGHEYPGSKVQWDPWDRINFILTDVLLIGREVEEVVRPLKIVQQLQIWVMSEDLIVAYVQPRIPGHGVTALELHEKLQVAPNRQLFVLWKVNQVLDYEQLSWETLMKGVL